MISNKIFENNTYWNQNNRDKKRNLSNPSFPYFDCTYFCTSNKWSTCEEISEVENDAIEISFEEH